MKMTQSEYIEYENDYAGYCSCCDEITTYSVEPDAEDYFCEDCENDSVMGMMNAMLIGKIELEED